MKIQSVAAITLLAVERTSAFTVSTPNRNVVKLSMVKEASETNISRRNALPLIFSAVATTAIATPVFAREPRAEYLTEPTDDFKESERQRDEFRRSQLTIKRNFNLVLDRLTFESKSEEELKADLVELRQLVTSTGGLPLGIKKEELVKIIRAKKAKGFWPTPVEVAYQALTTEIAFQQSPNRDKDTANPL
jgi:hypothetical protein